VWLKTLEMIEAGVLVELTSEKRSAVKDRTCHASRDQIDSSPNIHKKV
jgi:hypothetical protein